MKRTALLVLVAFGLSACAPSVPDSGAGTGVGFENYQDYGSYRAQRDAELSGAPPPVTVLPPQAGPDQTAATPGADPEASAETVAAAPVVPNNPGISDEQDFDAVSNRESIESDAERLKAQRQVYQVIEPTALPTRSGAGGPNIVAYALSTSNAVGQQVWRRSTVFAQGRYDRNCAKYASDDAAQEAFLRAGGPERDRKGLDPDGDGFACGWDPSPFRRISVANG